MDDADKNDTLRLQLQNAVALAAKQDTIVWAVFSVFAAASGALLVALFPEGKVASGTMGMVLCGPGFVGSLIWRKLLGRTLLYFTYYEDRIRGIEAALGIPGDLSLASRPPGSSNRDLIKGTVLAVAILWGLGLIIFAVRLGVELCIAAFCCPCR